MSAFITEDFLLGNASARRLFDAVRDLPIVDFHSHLDARDIAEDRHWENISQLWLAGDHYKWRAMRWNGVPETFCAGNGDDREKFRRFAATMPRLLRNPLYHWCHLELARYLGVDDLLLGPDTEAEIWERSRAALANGLGARACLRISNVEIVCTTDDPADDLAWHRACAADSSLATRVFPTFRPDRARDFANPPRLAAYLRRLSAASGVTVNCYAALLSALKQRHDFFHAAGCRASDHGIPTVWHAPASELQLERAFQNALSGSLSEGEFAALQTGVLLECARMDFDSGWTRQLHIGPARDTNSRALAALGPDTGFDSIGSADYIAPLARHLDALDSEGRLGRTILYNIHPRDTEALAALAGSFQDALCPGKIQLGAAWWFLDQLDGMRRQLEAVSALGSLPNFVGMLTDSRSFLSFSRHEYFRRLLCGLLGREMEDGLLPGNLPLVAAAARDISYFNPKNFFRFPERGAFFQS
ncbi:MAG: glucuronate isomerase [Opitutaceae bacterium]|jgi:glucuronate isomerase|nr:glucuronate isomerase [Opitutaceae bacterium]